MAYKTAQTNKEHAYKTVEQDIRADQIKGVVLFFGKETYLIDWAIRTLVEKEINPACKDFDFIRFNGLTATFEEIRNSAETLPMLSEKKIIVVDNLKCLESESEEEAKWSSYFREIPEFCQLILVSERVDGRRKIIKTINELGKVYEFDQLPEAFLKKFIEKQMKVAGKCAKPLVIAEFIDGSGYYDKNTDYTLYNLDNDLKKLMAHCTDDEILKQDVSQTLSGNIERDIFGMMDAIGSGKKGTAFEMLNHLMVYGENEYKILGLICSQFETVSMVKEMKEDGRSLAEIAEFLGLNPYRAKLMLALSEKYTLSQLKKILQGGYRVDKRIKTGIIEKNLALSLFIAEI